MTVVIVGGRVGGLTAALLLHQAGIEAEVHERAAQIRALGVGINLLPRAVAPLAGLGLLDALDARAVRTAEPRYTGSGPRSRRACGPAAGFPVPQLSVHRGTLLAVLHHAVLDRLGPAAVRPGRLIGFAQHRSASAPLRRPRGAAPPAAVSQPARRRGRARRGPGLDLRVPDVRPRCVPVLDQRTGDAARRRR
jgi:2-polyprenyl-6-methoxyphenol hydroxylase-like FAD-dependent oxidoreductase